MKITYYKYYFKHKKLHIQNDIRPFLNAFAEIKSIKFKNSFTATGGDSLFLFHVGGNIYLFVIIKDNEIVKAINSNKLSHKDIHEKLEKDERLGFASYVYVEKNYYGIASTFFGPKNTYWTDFINDIIQRLNINNCYLESSPFPTSATRNEIMDLSFKGSTYIQINKKSKIWSQMAKLLCIGDDVNRISIQFKPEPRREMSLSNDNIAKNLQDDGLEKYIVKGKQTLQDAITDFYIVGSGHISDSIIASGEVDICNAINEKVRRNQGLKSAVKDYTDDDSYSKRNIEIIANYHNLDNWLSHF
ncbi:hypothetical protein ACUUL3_00205 [Thiovibrio sp. JS02]